MGDPQGDGPTSPCARHNQAAAGAAATNPQRLSPFATMADQPIEPSSSSAPSTDSLSPPPAPNTRAGTQRGGRRGGAAARQQAGQGGAPSDARSPSPVSTRRQAAPVVGSAPSPAPAAAAPPPASPAAAVGPFDSSNHSQSPSAAAASAAALIAAINAVSSRQQQPMGAPRRRQRLTPQQLQEQLQLQQLQRLQADAQAHQQHQQQALQLAQQQAAQQQQQQQPGSFQAALVSCMVRDVARGEVNDLKNDIAVLTQFDIQQVNKSRRGPEGNSSSFRGVTRHRRTQRWEAHIWDTKKQVYLGGFDNEVAAAKAHDIMALKTRGTRTLVNFKLGVYADVLPYLQDEELTREAVITALRGASKALQRHQAKTNRGAGSIRAGGPSHSSPHGSPDEDDSHLAVAALLAAAAGNGSSPRTPVGRGMGLGGGEGGLLLEEDEEVVRAEQLLRKAKAAGSRGRKAKSGLAEVMAAAAAAAAGGDSEDSNEEYEEDAKEAELAELLAGGGGGSRAGGRGRKGSKAHTNNHRSKAPSPMGPPASSSPRPHSSPNLPGLNPFPPGLGAGLHSSSHSLNPPGLTLGRAGLSIPGLFTADAYGSQAGFGSLGGGYGLNSCGFRAPGYTPSPPGMRPQLLGGSFGQGLGDLGEPGGQNPLGYNSLSHPHYPHHTAAATRDLLTIQSLDVTEGMVGLAGGGFNHPAVGFKAEPPSAEGTPRGAAAAGVPRRFSQFSGLSTQQLLDAASVQIGDVGFARPASQQGGVPPQGPPYPSTPASQGGSLANAAAAAAAAAAARSRGFDVNFSSLLSRPPLGQAAGQGVGQVGQVPFDMFNLAQLGPNSSSMQDGPAAAGAGEAAAGPAGLRNPPDDGMLIMSTPDEGVLIPNIHVGAQGLPATGGALESDIAGPGALGGYQRLQGQTAFPALDFLQSQRQAQQQQQQHAAAEAAAAMAANRAAGRDAEAAWLGGAADAASQQQLGLGGVTHCRTAGVKRGADGLSLGAAGAAAGAAATAAAGTSCQGITLPGFPVGEDEVAALEANHAAAAAALADADAAAAAAAAAAGEEEDPMEQAALDAAAAAAANAAELKAMAAAADAARRYTWPGSDPMGCASEAGAGLVTASQVQMYSPRAPAYTGSSSGFGTAAAGGATGSLLGAATGHLHYLQQQQQQVAGGLDVREGNDSGAAASTCFAPGHAGSQQPGTPGAQGPGAALHLTSPTQVAAMKEATSIAELAAAAAAVMSADANTPKEAAAAAAAAAATSLHACSAAELFYREARMSAAALGQHMQQQGGVPPMVPHQPGSSMPSTPSSSLRATAAAAQAAMAAAIVAATESAGPDSQPDALDPLQLQSRQYPEDSLAFNNQQQPAYNPSTLPAHTPPPAFARQPSGNAASSFSLPSEGTATAAAALAGLAYTGGGLCRQRSSGLLSYSPTNSQLQQQQQQVQEVEGAHSGGQAPCWGGPAQQLRPHVAAQGGYLPSLGSDPTPSQPLRSNSPANRASPPAAASPAAPLLPAHAPTPGLLVPTAARAVAGPGGDLPASFQWAGSQQAGVGQVTAAAGCSSSKPPLPPPAAQAPQAAAAGAAGDGLASASPRERAALQPAADRLLSPAGSGTSRLPAATTLGHHIPG